MKRSVWFAVAIFALLCVGCAAWNPGGQVKQALTQSTKYGWNEHQFTADIKGTQEAAFTMIEGDIVMVKNEEGNMVPDLEQSTITAYLYSNPTSKGAVESGATFAEMGMRQTEAIFNFLSSVLPYLRKPEPAPEQPIP